MRISHLTILALMGATALGACGENRASRASKDAPSAPETASAPTPPPEPVETPASTPTEAASAVTDDWRKVANSADASQLERLDEAWRQARIEAEDAGYAAQVEKLGALADPNAARAGRVQPGPGTYRCRTVKLGTRGGGTLAYVDYPFFSCRVELTPGGDLILTKTTGSQRFQGRLYPDGDSRVVYVGSQAWGDERGFPTYGEKPERDQAGVVERIGENRWRVVLPWPKQESKLDLIEVVR